MRRSHSLELVLYNTKIEKTLQVIRAAKKFETHEVVVLDIKGNHRSFQANDQ